MLYEPAEFEPLTDELWDPARIEDSIAAIVVDADAAFDSEALGPAHEWDGWEEPLPLKSLYVGAAGVIWALDALAARRPRRNLPRPRRRGVAYGRAQAGGADAAIAAETMAVLTRHAFREDGLANWPGSPLPQLARPRDGRICLQWCTGAPGVIAGAWEYLDEELLLAGGELTWRAGAHGDVKGHGICHGTSGNGFALLKAFARTGDERWLVRARRFAVHALAQAERLRATNGRGRYSLWTGDAGTALFAAACLDADARYPILDIV